MNQNLSLQKRPLPFFGGVGLSLRSDSSGYGWQISLSDAESFLQRIAAFQTQTANTSLNALPPHTALQIAGGEPFSQLDDLESLLDTAMACNMRAEVTTLAAWVRDSDHAYAVLQRFKDKIYPLDLYLTHAHLQCIGLQPVQHLLDASCALHMSINVHCGLFPHESFPAELLELESMNSHTVILRAFPLNIQDAAHADAPWLLQEPPRHRRCADMMGFLIAPNGDVFPCSRSYGIQALRLGNLHTDTVSAIADRALTDAALLHLRDQGPYYLYQACKSSPEAAALKPGYMDSCDFHRHVLEDAKLRSVVEAANAALRFPAPLASSAVSPFHIFQE